MVYIADLKSAVERHEGSSPSTRTIRPDGGIGIRTALRSQVLQVRVLFWVPINIFHIVYQNVLTSDKLEHILYRCC